MFSRLHQNNPQTKKAGLKDVAYTLQSGKLWSRQIYLNNFQEEGSNDAAAMIPPRSVEHRINLPHQAVSRGTRLPKIDYNHFSQFTGVN